MLPRACTHLLPPISTVGRAVLFSCHDGQHLRSSVLCGLCVVCLVYKMHACRARCNVPAAFGSTDSHEGGSYAKKCSAKPLLQ